MRSFLQSISRNALLILAIASILVVGSNNAPAREQEQPRAKAWLGVSIRDVTEKVAKENKLADESGAFVMEVVDHSPADSAGIEEKDIIVEFGQHKVDDADGLMKAVGKSKVGDKINVVFFRKGEKKNTQVVLAKFPRRKEAPYTVDNLLHRMRIFANRSDQGMQLMELNDQLGEYFGVTNGAGILVEKVKKGSAAEKAGIKAGDVLLKVGKRTIDDLEDVSKALSKYDQDDKVDFEVLRKGSNKICPLEIAKDRDNSPFKFFRHGSPDGEMFRGSPFEENHFEIPHWDNQDNRIEFQDFRPDMKTLERNLQNMEKSFKEHQEVLMESIQHLRFRSI